MENDKLKQYAQAAADALANGAQPAQVAQELAGQNIEDKDIKAIMDIAMNAAENAAPDTGAGADAISLEDALKYFDGLGIDPQIIMAVLQIVLKMEPDDVDQLMAIITKSLQEGQAAQGQQGPMDGTGPAPDEGQGSGGPPQGQPRYEI